MAAADANAKQRAPTLYGIIAIKLVKGLLLLLLALGVYRLAEENLQSQFRSLLQFLHVDPERKFFTDVAGVLAGITPANVYWFAAGTAFYSLFSLVEGVGLLFRVPWACWMAIGESAFFIPIEIYELIHRASWKVVIILVLNAGIVWYLAANRRRLFKHHVSATNLAGGPGGRPPGE